MTVPSTGPTTVTPDLAVVTGGAPSTDATAPASFSSLLGSLLAHAPVAIAGFDDQLVCTCANGRFAALVGRDHDDVVGGAWDHLLPTDLAALGTVRTVLAGGRPGDEVRFHRDRAGRREVWRLQLYRVPLGDGRTGVGVVAEDVTEVTERVDQLTRRADLDALTGLLNREAFHARLRETAEQLSQHPPTSRRPVSVLVLDLDDFKDVNDHYGHLAGDAVLAEVGRRLRATLRPTDVAGRLGGDEFAVLGQGAGPRAGAALGRRVQAVVREPVALADGTQVRIGLTVGRVELDPTQGALEALAAADVAMYAAKRHQAGRRDRPVPSGAQARREGEVVVERACGVVMGRTGCSERQALAALAAIARATHRDVVTVALEMEATVLRGGRSTPGRRGPGAPRGSGRPPPTA